MNMLYRANLNKLVKQWWFSACYVVCYLNILSFCDVPKCLCDVHYLDLCRNVVWCCDVDHSWTCITLIGVALICFQMTSIF